ncbi:M15 family metallopeptidase [Kytococcus schroeteri]|uniref:M15 family metallopeptidase n=1 Tax=Kytococcus schroeteri TaxID=138300 RepID=UPI0035E52572
MTVQRGMRRGAWGTGVLVAGLVLAGCGGGTGSGAGSPSGSETVVDSPAGTSEPSVTPSAPGSGTPSPPSGAPSSSPASDDASAPVTPAQDAAPNPTPGEGGAVFTGPYLHPDSITPREVTEVGPHTIVNRANALPEDWEPAELVAVEGAAKEGTPMRLAPEAAAAWGELRAAAAADGINLRINAAYRSYSEQEAVWEHYEAQDPDHVMVYTAAPGRSEHQMGLAIDIADMPKYPKPVGDNARGRWLLEHAAEHGWVLRYPKGREKETGYRYEAWHWRWVGKDLAQQLKRDHATMEQWAGLVR